MNNETVQQKRATEQRNYNLYTTQLTHNCPLSKGNIRRHVNHCRVSGGKKSKGVNGSTGAVGGASNNASIGGIQQQVQTASMLPHTGKSSGGGPSAKRRKFAPAAAEEWSVAPGEMTLYEHS